MFAPRLVHQADKPPFRCIFTGLIDGPLVDCGAVESVPMQTTNAFLHPTAIYQIGSEIGMVTEDEHQKALARVEELETQLHEAEQRAEEAQAAYDAVDGLTRQGMVIRKQPGRKPRNTDKEKVA